MKLHLAAIRTLFDYLVIGQIVPVNPAASVRGPRHVVRKGKTPVLTAEQARQLIDAIDTSTIAGIRDRALIGVMVFSFARVSVAIGMSVADYYPQGRRMWFRLHEKGGKRHEVPAHHNAEAYVDAYIKVAGIADEKHGPLFRTVDSRRTLTLPRMHRSDVLRMIKRRARQAGIDTPVCCHTFRATGITAYLQNGGLLEHAQRIASHESVRTTKLYDRTTDILLTDCLLSTWTEMVLLQQRGVDSVSRLNRARRSADFRRGKRLGKEDHIVRWSKPRRKPVNIDREAFNALPEFLEVRELRIRTVMAQAADKHAIEPRTISFKGTIQTLEAFQPLLDYQGHRGSTFRKKLYQQLLDCFATHRVADRPDRFEPRLRKRRPKH